MRNDLFSQLKQYERNQATKFPTSGTVAGIDGDTIDVAVRGSSTILRNMPVIGEPTAVGEAVVLSWENGMPTAHITGSTSKASVALVRGPAGPEGPEGPQGPQGPAGPTGSLEAASPITMIELASTPSNPPSGSMSIYPKTDHKFYKLQSDGTEEELGSGGGGNAVLHSLAMAANDFLVATGAGAFVKKTLAETVTILRTVLDSIYAPASHTHAPVSHTHTSRQILYHHCNSATIAAGGTQYITLSIPGLGALNGLTWPVAGTFRNLSVRINSQQPVSGTLVFTIMKNLVDTTVVATVPAGAAASTQHYDTTHSASFSANELLTVKVKNNASAVSALITSVSFEFQTDTV